MSKKRRQHNTAISRIALFEYLKPRWDPTKTLFELCAMFNSSPSTVYTWARQFSFEYVKSTTANAFRMDRKIHKQGHRGFQVYLPVPVARALGVGSRSKVEWVVEGDKAYLQKKVSSLPQE